MNNYVQLTSSCSENLFCVYCFKINNCLVLLGPCYLQLYLTFVWLWLSVLKSDMQSSVSSCLKSHASLPYRKCIEAFWKNWKCRCWLLEKIFAFADLHIVYPEPKQMHVFQMHVWADYVNLILLPSFWLAQCCWDFEGHNQEMAHIVCPQPSFVIPVTFWEHFDWLLSNPTHFNSQLSTTSWWCDILVWSQFSPDIGAVSDKD